MTVPRFWRAAKLALHWPQPPGEVRFKSLCHQARLPPRQNKRSTKFVFNVVDQEASHVDAGGSYHAKGWVYHKR